MSILDKIMRGILVAGQVADTTDAIIDVVKKRKVKKKAKPKPKAKKKKPAPEIKP